MAEMLIEIDGKPVTLVMSPAMLDGLHAMIRARDMTTMNVLKPILEQQPENFSEKVKQQIVEFFKNPDNFPQQPPELHAAYLETAAEVQKEQG
jgi:hypothetical protein